MGAGLKRATAAAKATRRPQWEVRWRGRITRDVGSRFLYADTEAEVRASFIETYPLADIVSIERV